MNLLDIVILENTKETRGYEITQENVGTKLTKGFVPFGFESEVLVGFPVRRRLTIQDFIQEYAEWNIVPGSEWTNLHE